MGATVRFMTGKSNFHAISSEPGKASLTLVWLHLAKSMTYQVSNLKLCGILCCAHVTQCVVLPSRNFISRQLHVPYLVPHFHIRPNEEPIGPWVKMATSDHSSLQNSAFSSCCWEVNTSLVKCFLLFFWRRNMAKIQKNYSKRSSRHKIIWKN